MEHHRLESTIFAIIMTVGFTSLTLLLGFSAVLLRSDNPNSHLAILAFCACGLTLRLGSEPLSSKITRSILWNKGRKDAKEGIFNKDYEYSTAYNNGHFLGTNNL